MAGADISHSCDGCRRVKEKCDGGVPCRRCFRLGRPCEFSSRVNRVRDVPPPPAPSAAPEANSRTHRSGPSSSDLVQRAADLEKVLRHYAGNIPLDSETLRNLVEGAERSSTPPRQDPGSITHSSQYADMDEENFSIQPLDNNITHYSGEFSHWNFSMRIKQWIDQSVPNDSPNQHPSEATKFKEYYRAEELQPLSNILSCLSSMPPRYVADFLIYSFYKHAEANYFFVEKDWLVGKIELVYENPTSMSRREVGTVCMIFMVLAIGTQYAYLESLADQRRNLSRGEPEDAGPFSEDTVSVMFYQQACRLLPDVITIASLESVQACLLIGMYTLPLDASGLSYIYLNLAVKLAIQNGMHREYPGEGLDAAVQETRNRVWWTAYTIEKRVGIFHGRPKSIQSSDVDVSQPANRLDIWPSTTDEHTAHVLATLHLNEMLSKMAHEISVLRTKGKNKLSEGLERLVVLRRELMDWWSGLPDATFCKEPCAESRITRSGMHLKLEFCLVRMFVGRAFIFPRERGSTGGQSASPTDHHMRAAAADASSSTTTTAGAGTGTAGVSGASGASGAAGATATSTVNAPASSSSKSHSRSILISDCIEAALSAIQTCRLLHETIGLARASYTEFSACRAALLVITTQCLQERTDRFRKALRDGLSLLKEMSAGGESARSEMSLIEAFERAVARLDATTVEERTRSARAESEYVRFKKWEQSWKTDSSTLDTTSENLHVHDSLMPMAPQPAGSWRAAEASSRQGMVPMPASKPFFGMDGNFAAFPRNLDEFSSFFGYGFGPSPDSAENVGNNPNETVWMGPGPS